MTEAERNLALDTMRAVLRAFSDEDRASLLADLTRRAQPHNTIALSRESIESAIQSSGSIAAAAILLGVARKTLQSKMHQLGMPPGRAGRRPRVVAK